VALTHLLDTSVISRLGAESVRAVVDPLTHAGRVGRAGITDLEVGYGSRNAREWDPAAGCTARWAIPTPSVCSEGWTGRGDRRAVQAARADLRRPSGPASLGILAERNADRLGAGPDFESPAPE
jgi:hypothetical protein